MTSLCFWLTMPYALVLFLYVCFFVYGSERLRRASLMGNLIQSGEFLPVALPCLRPGLMCYLSSLVWYTLPWRLWGGMNTSPSSQYMSALFSWKHREYCLTRLIFSMLSMSSYPLAENIEYPDVNATVLKTHQCLPELKSEIMLLEAAGVMQQLHSVLITGCVICAKCAIHLTYVWCVIICNLWYVLFICFV